MDDYELLKQLAKGGQGTTHVVPKPKTLNPKPETLKICWQRAFRARCTQYARATRRGPAATAPGSVRPARAVAAVRPLPAGTHALDAPRHRVRCARVSAVQARAALRPCLRRAGSRRVSPPGGQPPAGRRRYRCAVTCVVAAQFFEGFCHASEQAIKKSTKARLVVKQTQCENVRTGNDALREAKTLQVCADCVLLPGPSAHRALVSDSGKSTLRAPRGCFEAL